MGHIVNPISYRLSKSKFWISSWNNITKSIYKNLFFEDMNLKRIFNWFRCFSLWRKLNIFISLVKFSKFFKRLVIHLNVGILEYYHKPKNYFKVSNYIESEYNRFSLVNRIHNKGFSSSIFKSLFGGFVKNFVKRWGYLVYAVKWEYRYLIQITKRVRFIKSLYKQSFWRNRFQYTDNDKIKIKSYFRKRKKVFILFNKKSINKKLLNIFSIKSFSIGYIKNIHKELNSNKKYFLPIKIFKKAVQWNINRCITKNMRQAVYNSNYQASNNNRDIFKTFGFGSNRFHTNKFSPYLLGKLLFEQKDGSFFNNFNNFKELGLFNSQNTINIAGLNLNNLLYKDSFFIKEDTKIIKLYNINLYYRNQYTFYLLSNINRDNKNIIRSNNLRLYNLKKEQLRLNKRKGHTFLFGYDRYKKISNSYRRFFIPDIRRKNHHLLKFEGEWNSSIKKKVFIGLFMRNFLLYFIKKIFFIDKKVVINLLDRKHNSLEGNAFGLKKTTLVRIAANYKIGHFLGILKKVLDKGKYVKGFKLRAVGRYQKKLRNRKIEINSGKLAYSNINSPISYINFVIVYRFGICGIKINILRDYFNYEIL